MADCSYQGECFTTAVDRPLPARAAIRMAVREQIPLWIEKTPLTLHSLPMQGQACSFLRDLPIPRVVPFGVTNIEGPSFQSVAKLCFSTAC